MNNFLILIMLAMVPVALGYIAGSEVGYYSLVLSQFGIIGYSLLKYKIRKDIGFVFLSMLILVYSEIIIGAINSILGRNDFHHYIIYTGLGAMQVIAFYAGMVNESSSTKENNDNVSFIIYGLGMIELTQILSRFFVIGLDVRTSLGFSFLFPLVMAYIMGRNNLKFKNIVATVYLIIFSFIILLSGLRSIFVMGIFLIAASLIAMLKSNKNNYKNIFYRLCAIVLFFVVVVYGLNSNAVDRSLNIITTRFSQTLFVDTHIKIDPEGGRVEEANDALYEFSKGGNLFDLLMGRGFGFSFAETGRGDANTAHIHITPVAYYVRGGIMGATFYFLIILYCIYMIWLCFRAPRGRLIYFCTSLWGMSSLFAGLIIGPAFWFIFGYSISMINKLGRKK
jgi:hypothetical protein